MGYINIQEVFPLLSSRLQFIIDRINLSDFWVRHRQQLWEFVNFSCLHSFNEWFNVLVPLFSNYSRFVRARFIHLRIYRLNLSSNSMHMWQHSRDFWEGEANPVSDRFSLTLLTLNEMRFFNELLKPGQNLPLTVNTLKAYSAD